MDPTTRSAIIRGKTAAWTSPEAVAMYEAAMDSTSGSTLLKNSIEPLLIGRHVRGHRILDVGIGTGRASLPLLERGLDVTGVDSSQGMLDATRRRAGDRPITLIPGDVTALPFADASFDAIVSLNVTTHFPHWQDIMAEWSRVVRPGGRMVFDLLSADHADAVLAVTGSPAPHSDPGGAYQLHVRAAELAPDLDRLGLHVVGTHPYGMLSLTLASTAWLRGTLAEGALWERILSWVAFDPKLLDMLIYIEEAIIGRLSTETTGRFMMVLEKTPDPAANARWLAENARMARALRSGFSLATVGAIVGQATWAQWSECMNAFLDYPPNCIAFFRLYDMAIAGRYPIALDELLAAPLYAQIHTLEMRRRAEGASWQFVQRLALDPELAPLLRPRADIGPGMEAELAGELARYLRGQFS